MKKTNLLLVLLAFVTLFSSCNNDDDEGVAPVSARVGLLTRPKTWKISAFTINPGVQLQQNGPLVTDLYAAFGSTYQDNIIRFTANPNVYLREEGGTKGQFDDQIGDVGDWYMSSDENAIVLASKTGSLTSCDVVDLSQTTLQLRYTIQLQQGGTVYTLTESYTAQ